ncbi:hypothetical protein NHG22_07315 [Streptomyces sp. ATE26]|uniref:hypothetical protein n=1 Tax=Streptomyces sp. ATE26 TaxID=2954237 RepID=UPI002482CBDC|nr:hypothetical protein [Streptomyces sp. ATE26]MDI1453624.1 hypothetical protein [Streptomyces sp. ATE26]
MTASHSQPASAARHVPQGMLTDPFLGWQGIGIATITSKQGRPRFLAGTESGVAVVDVTVTEHDHALKFTVPSVPSPHELAPDLAEALSAEESLRCSPSRELHARSVDRLAARTLLLSRSDRWCEAISTALLGSWSAPLWAEGYLPSTAVGALKAEARLLHRQLVPLWRRRTRHGRVLSLDSELGDGLSLYDLVATNVDMLARVAEGVFDDERLNAVLRGLTPNERRVVLARGYGEGTTWTEAAAVAGAAEPKVFGEQVRRKAIRLALEQNRRMAQRISYLRTQELRN